MQFYHLQHKKCSCRHTKTFNSATYQKKYQVDSSLNTQYLQQRFGTYTAQVNEE